MISRIQYLLVLIALIIGIFLRLYRIEAPVADWHSFRQADTASVTRQFLKKGIDLLHPTYHDLSNVQSGFDNPQGFRFVEFPIYNLTTLIFHQLFHSFFSGLTLEMSHRLVNILLSLATAWFIFRFIFKITHQFWPSFLSLSTFLFLPFSIYYSRAILPEPTAVFFMVLTLYLSLFSPLASAIPFALAILVKPYTALILFPSLLYISLSSLKKNLRPLNILNYLAFTLVSLAPFIAWRLWMKQFPEGIPVNSWLLAQDKTLAQTDWYHGIQVSRLLSTVSFRPYWFRWLFYERIANLILGSFGLIPLFLGFAYKRNKIQTYLSLLAGGVVFYFAIVARGNIQHDYYQALITPIIAIAVGLGLYYQSQYLFKNKLASLLSLALICFLSLSFSWYQIRGYYQINNPAIMEAGQKVDEITPDNSIIVAPYTGDTAFLYQTNRIGYPVEIYDIPAIKKRFPESPLYLVSINFDTYTNSISQKYSTLYRNDKFIILDLNHDQQK